jgi:hypothetical protein
MAQFTSAIHELESGAQELFFAVLDMQVPVSLSKVGYVCGVADNTR